MADENLTLVIMKEGQPIGKPIQVGEFSQSAIYDEMVAVIRGHCAPYKINAHISRVFTKEEKLARRSKGAVGSASA